MREPPPPLSPDVALFFDFDGTLTEIAATPDTICVAPDLPALLRMTAWGLNGALAIVSGRRILTIDGYIQGSLPAVAGVSGSERRSASGQIHRAVLDNGILNPARAIVSQFARTRPGVLIEDKETSLAVHYRLASHYADECHDIVARCAADSHGRLEKISSNMVVELRPSGVRKAAAVSAYMNEPPFAGRCPVFVGDDPIDEDAFAEVNRSNGYSVVVGKRADTVATHSIATVADVHEWLRTFAQQVSMGMPTDRPRGRVRSKAISA